MKNQFDDVIQYEIAKEKAEALGRTEQRVLQALDAFRALESRGDADATAGAKRARLLWRLVDVVTAYVVQREACGLNDSDYVLELYDIPAEVVARIGARPPVGVV